jgi:hypothetical protein
MCFILICFGSGKNKSVVDKRKKKQTFTDGVSSLYAETNDVAGSWDFS